MSVEQGVSKSTVYKITTKNCKNRAIVGICDKENLAGRPKNLSERNERIILSFIESGEYETAVEVSKYLSKFHKNSISPSKIRRLLQKA